MKVIITLFLISSSAAHAVKSDEIKIIAADIAGVFKKKSNKELSTLTKIQGREERIINETFNCMQKKPNFTLMPFGRHTYHFENTQTFDAVTTVYDSVNLKGYPSRSHIKYFNGVSYLTENVSKPINSIKDLAGKRVISFVGARKMFKELESVIPKMRSYTENSNQAIHSKMLFSKRVDVVISDAIIFAHHTSQLQQIDKTKYNKQVSFKQIFEPSTFKMYFKSEKIRDSFNSCLEKLYKNDIIQRLNIEYYNEMIINK